MPKIHDQLLDKYCRHRSGGTIRVDEPVTHKEKRVIPDAQIPTPATQFSPSPIIGLSETSKGGFAGLGLNDINFFPPGKRKEKPKKVRLLINEK